MRVSELINNEKTVCSFELLPPLKGQNADKLYRTIESLMEFDPKYINITTHRDEVEYRELPNGLLQKFYTKKRPGTVAIAAAIQHRFGVPVVPHVVCGGFDKEETENMLLDLNFLGIENVLALRGDGLKTETVFQPETEGHRYANELVEQIANLKEGKYLDPNLKNNTPLDFCIGVAGYPEKHFESPNPEDDLAQLKKKIDAGAEYIVTQMFFDNQRYFDFVDRCRKADIHVPIIPGLKPISTLNHRTILPKIFSIDLPLDLTTELNKCKCNADVRVVGTEWAIHQAKELIEHKVPSLHMYTMGLADNTKKILETVL